MEPSGNVVKHWPERSATEGPLNADGVERTLDNLVHRGLLANLFKSCAENIAALRSKSCMSATTQRLHRQSIRGVEHTFSLLRDAFEGGEIESCLSLDSDLQHKVTTLLYDIGKILSKGHRTHLAEGQRPDQDELHHKPSASPMDSVLELERHLVTAKKTLKLSSSDSESSSSNTSSDDTSSDASASVPPRLFYGLRRTDLKSLSTYVELLMSLCPTLEQLYGDRHRKCMRTLTRPSSTYSTPQALLYAQLVKGSFPLAHPRLAERLGEANWLRHKYLQFPSDAVKKRRSASESPISPQSEEKYFVASDSSSIYNDKGLDGRDCRVPGIPANAVYGKPFCCPFCDETLHTINNRAAWKLHVFADLQAYVCVDLDCADGLKLFSNRAAWLKHMSTQHLSRCQFHCKLCPTVCDSEDNFLHHISGGHSIALNTAQLRSAVLAPARKVHLNDPEKLQCPLCRRHNICTTHREFAIHVGRELEEVALLALPPQKDSDYEGEEPSDSVLEGLALWTSRFQKDIDHKGGETSGSVPEEIGLEEVALRALRPQKDIDSEGEDEEDSGYEGEKEDSGDEPEEISDSDEEDSDDEGEKEDGDESEEIFDSDEEDNDDEGEEVYLPLTMKS